MYEILFSIGKIVNHDPKNLPNLEFKNIPEKLISKYDAAKFKLPYFNRNNFITKISLDSLISKPLLSKKRKLKELPTGLNVTEYATFFNECLIDSVCSHKSEEHAANLSSKILNNALDYDEKNLFYDDLTFFFFTEKSAFAENSSHLEKFTKSKIFNRWEYQISGLISGSFESLLSQAILKKSEKFLSFSFKLVSESSAEIFVILKNPEPILLTDGRNVAKTVLRIELHDTLKEYSDAINCNDFDLKKFAEELKSRQPFVYLEL